MHAGGDTAIVQAVGDLRAVLCLFPLAHLNAISRCTCPLCEFSHAQLLYQRCLADCTSRMQ